MGNPPSRKITTRDPAVNDFYNTRAWDDMLGLNSVVYEYWLDSHVIGFVTANMSKLRAKIDEDQPEWAYPALLLGQLGVDQNYSGKDYGVELVHYILGLAHSLKEKVGCRIVFLDVYHLEDEESGKKVENERLIRYYTDIGFDRSSVQHRKKKLTTLFFDLASDQDSS